MSKESEIDHNLRKIRDKEVFRVPENYFTNFQDRIMNKVRESESKESGITISWRNIRPQLLFAASFIGIAIIISAGMKYLSERKAIYSFTSDEVAEIIEYQLADIDESTITDAYESSYTQEIPDEYNLNSEAMDEIVDYLVYEDVDIQLLAQEL